MTSESVIFVSPGGKTFHVTEDCSRLSISKSFEAITLENRGRRMPCKVCVPYAPRTKFIKRRCPVCCPDRPRPCAHNGGIPVQVPCTVKFFSSIHTPGDTYYVQRYVWPDSGVLYTPA